MLISPEHFELNQKYQKLLLKSMQQEKFLEKAQGDYKQLSSKVTTLQNFVDDFTGKYKELQEQYAEAIRIIKEKDKQLQKLELIEHQYQQLQRLMYAKSSEKSSVTSGQLLLELNAEVVEACHINDGKRISEYTKHKGEKHKHPGRNQIPAHIPREYVDILPDNVPDDAVLIDTIETEQLEYDPAKLFATVYRRPKYMFKNSDGTTEFFIASLPEEKDKSIAAPSLKAHVTTEKYMWHTPIYRQRQKFSSAGIILHENTIGDWINGVCRSLTALYDEHRKAIVHPACGYMMADETGITVLDSEKGKGKKSHTGYMWAYCNPVDRLVFFEYQKGRGNKHARPVLQHYKGYLHTDGYNVYKHYQNLSFDQRKEIRQEKSVPIFEELKAWIKEEILKLLTLRSPIGKAMAYFSEREKQLSMFLHDGMLLMDTNLIENTIRPIALGRNNYLFAGSHDAAQNAAIIYSLFATCKLHEVNAYDWLKYVITAMPTFPAGRIKELLPQNWNQLITAP